MTDRLERLESTVEKLSQTVQAYMHHLHSADQTPAASLSQKLASLYETDLMAWCEAQAATLRDSQYNHLDLVHLIEEIEDMGREQFRKTPSLVRQIILHILKLQAFPEDQASRYWRGEIVGLQSELEDVISGSICYRFEQQEAFLVQQQKALKQLKQQYPDTDFQSLSPMNLEDVLKVSGG
jgi:hypothetical protein